MTGRHTCQLTAQFVSVLIDNPVTVRRAALKVRRGLGNPSDIRKLTQRGWKVVVYRPEQCDRPGNQSEGFAVESFVGLAPQGCIKVPYGAGPKGNRRSKE